MPGPVSLYDQTFDPPRPIGSGTGGTGFPSSNSGIGTGTDRSGTITTGGSAQSLAAANTSRRSLTGQNKSAGDLWINEVGGAAVVGGASSYQVAAGATFTVNTNQAVSIIGATTGQAFAATEVS